MAVDPVIGPIVGAVGAALGSIGAARRSKRNIEQQKEANKELAQFAYSKDLEQWERANLYNTPSAQMARLKEAGLNPRLVYGSGSAAGITSQATSPKYQTVRTDFSQRRSPLEALDMLGQFQSFELAKINIDSAKAERDIKELHRNWMLTKTPETITGPFGKREVVMRPSGAQLFSTQLEIQKETLRRIHEDTRSRMHGADIKAIEAEWLQLMKSVGIGGKLGIPMLRMLLGK